MTDRAEALRLLGEAHSAYMVAANTSAVPSERNAAVLKAIDRLYQVLLSQYETTPVLPAPVRDERIREALSAWCDGNELLWDRGRATDMLEDGVRRIVAVLDG